MWERISELPEVLIIGAGPAGCAAALRARQADLDVVLLEAAESPRLSPGETLHPGVEPLLSQLGVRDKVLKAGFPRHHAIWYTEDCGRQLTPYGEDESGPWQGFQVDRRQLQHILQDAVVRQGAHLFSGVKVEAILLDKKAVAGVLIDGELVRAAWTIDATGQTAWLADQLKLEARIESPRLGVRFGWFNGTREELMGQPAFEFRCDGWDWLAPIGECRMAWAELRIARAGDRPPPGIDQTWRFFPTCAGPGYFLLGDAAARLDPSSARGVLNALMSGLLCGHLIEACVYGSMTPNDASRVYCSWQTELHTHAVRQLREFYLNSIAASYFIS